MSMKMLANTVRSYVILSEVMPGYSYPASLVDQFEIFIDSLC